MIIKIDIQNQKEIIKQIKSLDDKMKSKIIIPAMRKSAKPMLNEAISAAPVSKRAHKVGKQTVQPGNLKRSITIMKMKSKEFPAIRIGGNLKKGVDAFYYRFLIKGSKAHKIKATKKMLKVGRNFAKSVNHPGTAPKDFLLKAFNTGKSAYLNLMIIHLDKGIAKAIK